MSVEALNDSEYVRRLAVVLLDRKCDDKILAQLVKIMEVDSDPFVIINALIFLNSLQLNVPNCEELVTKETGQ